MTSTDYRIREAIEHFRASQEMLAAGCSNGTEMILRRCMPRWDAGATGDVVIYADRLPEHPDSPILAMERLALGSRVGDWHPGQWHLVQGWRPGAGVDIGAGVMCVGHAFLVYRSADYIEIVQTGFGQALRSSVHTDVDRPWKQYTARLDIAALHEVT